MAAPTDTIRRIGLGLSILVVSVGVVGYFFVLSGGTRSLGRGSYEILNFESLEHSGEKDAYLACSHPACGQAIADDISVFIDAPLLLVRRSLAELTEESVSRRQLAFDLSKNQFDIGESIPGKPYYAILAVRLYAASETRTEVLIYAFQPIGPNKKQDHVIRARSFVETLKARVRRYQ